ncbi:MAG: MFS transporter [Promethearchaeota archaeon]
MSEQSKKSEVEQLSPWEKSPDVFDAKILFLISFGFFASSAAWSLYNSFVSDALDVLVDTLTIVGFLMTIDNIIGIFVQPVTGNLSDRTKSRFGRRKPFIMIGLPISAIAFIFIPVFETNLVVLLIVMFIFNFAMASWRAPVISLTPDFCPPKFRSKGNGIIVFLGAFGSIFSFLVGGILIDISPILAFGVISALMFVALFIIIFYVKEPDTRNWDFTYLKTQKEISLWENIKIVVTEKEKSPLFMLLAIFSLFVAYQALESMWTVYATESSIFDLTRGEATQCLTFVALPVMIFAVPSGIIAKKITRKKTIILGLIVCATTVFVGNFIKGSENINIMKFVIFPIFGIGWSLILINIIVMIWQMAPTAKLIGTYTGLYYFSSFLAAIVGPTILGFFMDLVVGLENMFIVCSAFLIIAIFLMLFVKRGEPTDLTKEEKEAREKAIQGVARG